MACGGYCRFPSAAPFHSVCEPPDIVKEAFEECKGEKHFMDAADLAKFMRTVQGDDGSVATEEQAAKLMTEFISYSWGNTSSRSLPLLGSIRTGSHSSRSSRRHGLLARKEAPHPPTFTLPAFLKFLLNPAFNGHRTPVSNTPTEDMTAPLSDYYIFASHNTYLTGNQLTSESSTSSIARALQSGCRVIELDCWSGLDGKINVLDCLIGSSRTINVLHGRTFTKAVAFEDCIQAIKDNAFLTSEYPVILTIENYLTQAHQKCAAKVLKKILDDMMFIPSANDRPPKSFQSPEALKNRIIISDKPPGDSVLSQVVEDPEFAEKVLKVSIWKQAPKGLKKILGAMMCVPSAKDRPPKPIQPEKPPADSVLSQAVEEPEFAERVFKDSIMRDYRSDSSDLEEGSHSSRREKKMHRRQNQVVAELRALRCRSTPPVINVDLQIRSL